MSIGTKIYTLFCGVKVGQDESGNRYYRARSTARNARQRRWVMYASEPEASKIPPTWHIWLHHMSDALPDAEDTKKYPWQKPHTPNLSGTNMAYFPPGHAAKGGNRYNVESDYEAWKP